MDETFKCLITDLTATRIEGNSYRIQVNDEYLFVRHGIRFDLIIQQDEFIKYKHILAGAILNKQLSDKEPNNVYWFTLTLDNLNEKLNQIVYPRTPKSKLDNLFKSLYQLQKIDGEVVQIFEVVSKPEFYYKLFFRTPDECYYYFKELDYQNLIKCVFSDNTNKPFKFRITFKGLNHYLELTERGDLSNKCFVAMSFDSELKETREAIRKAILQNNFDLLLMR
ncbi:MAG: hypothetical protein A2W95_07030 [Bacteroidetes bacterium GWA2_40_14]|nr:MAG: hypothetical protein A2W95_07030 [Bacteroidetes bacterium GWA2_40_14]